MADAGRRAVRRGVEFAGGQLSNDSKLAMGTGQLFASSYQQPAAASLAVTLGSAHKGLLQVTTTAALHGTLALRNTFQPAFGETASVLKAGSLTDSLSCTRTTGIGSTGTNAGHWADTHTATLLQLVWQPGPTPC